MNVFIVHNSPRHFTMYELFKYLSSKGEIFMPKYINVGIVFDITPDFNFYSEEFRYYLQKRFEHIEQDYTSNYEFRYFLSYISLKNSYPIQSNSDFFDSMDSLTADGIQTDIPKIEQSNFSTKFADVLSGLKDIIEKIRKQAGPTDKNLLFMATPYFPVELENEKIVESMFPRLSSGVREYNVMSHLSIKPDELKFANIFLWVNLNKECNGLKLTYSFDGSERINDVRVFKKYNSKKKVKQFIEDDELNIELFLRNSL